MPPAAPLGGEAFGGESDGDSTQAGPIGRPIGRSPLPETRPAYSNLPAKAIQTGFHEEEASTYVKASWWALQDLNL